MTLEMSEIAPYLKMGATPPAGRLAARILELAAEAPVESRGVWTREDSRCILCGTVGCLFDQWLRALSVRSAADALIAQAIGAAAVEKVMDGIEDEIRSTLGEGEELLPRRSPGYGNVPLSVNAELLRKLDASRRIGVSLTESMLLVPSKSVVAVYDIFFKNPLAGGVKI